MKDRRELQLDISILIKATLVFVLMVACLGVLSYASMYFCALRNFFSQMSSFNVEIGTLSANTSTMLSRYSHLEYVMYSIIQNISVISQMVALDIKFAVCYYMDMISRVKATFVVAVRIMATKISHLVNICKGDIFSIGEEDSTSVFVAPNSRLTI